MLNSLKIAIGIFLIIPFWTVSCTSIKRQPPASPPRNPDSTPVNPAASAPTPSTQDGTKSQGGSPTNPTQGPSPEGQRPTPADTSQSVKQIPFPLAANAPGNSPYHITDYGAALKDGKLALAKAADAQGASSQEKAVVIAIGMQETTHMNASERDSHKDFSSSANISILNINFDMVTRLGYTEKDWGESLDDPSRLEDAVGYLIKALRTWGVERTLNFQRGGSTAFDDGVSYGAEEYRNAIATIYNCIAADPSLENDGRRVEINVPGK